MGSISLNEKGLSFVYACLREFGGETYFVGFFLIAMIYIMMRKNDKERYLFCKVPVFLFLTIYNPFLANRAMHLMNMSAEFYRFFWILPIGLLLAYVCVRMTEKTEKIVFRSVFVFALILIIMFSGTPVISALSELKIPENKYKVPDELLAACEIIHRDAGQGVFPVAAFEYDYNTLVRQYDGTICLSLDRDLYLLELGSNTVTTRDLTEEEITNQRIIIQVIQNQNLEIDPLMFAAALHATETEYLVISKESQNVLAYLTSAGCISFADTGSHIIFRYSN